ncbi:MAG: ABC transporter permease [Coriobacteriia bacterium]|nr:ABC transporter permease [Coriobacteriia bacterium]
MVSVGARSMLQEKTRFAITSGGVALAVMLVLVLNGMYHGINDRLTSYVRNSPGDLIVSQPGTRNFIGARSSLPERLQGVAEDAEGVSRVAPIVAQYVTIAPTGRSEFSLLVGYDADRGGGPWRMVEGREPRETDEVVADATIAELQGLRVGDELEVLGRDLRIVGLSEDTYTWLAGMLFVTYDGAAELVTADGDPSFLLVTLEEGREAGPVIDDLERRLGGDAAVSSRQLIAANDRELYGRFVNRTLGFMALVGFLIGTTVVGIAMYNATAERRREYGTLKAIGIPNPRLFGVVLVQALVAASVGFVVGVGLALAAGEVIAWINPRFLVLVDAPALVRTGAATLAMGALATFIPSWLVARIDPAIAFRRGV